MIASGIIIEYSNLVVIFIIVKVLICSTHIKGYCSAEFKGELPLQSDEHILCDHLKEQDKDGLERELYYYYTLLLVLLLLLTITIIAMFSPHN